MALLKASDHKAIGWWADTFNLKMAMSTPPIIYFRPKAGGDEVTQHIDTIVGAYKGAMKEQSKEKARLNRGKKR